MNNKTIEKLESAVVRFAGDSGDGMQLTGDQFTTTAGVAGNDLRTFPDYPAEIRAPAGTMAGVSGFQIHFASDNVFTHGDAVDVLVAMNPAALKANLQDLKQNGILILNTDAFNTKNLSKVGFESSPLDDDSLTEKFQVIQAPITKLTRTALEDFDLPQNAKDRCKNLFALGVAYFLFMRDPATTYAWLETKFKNKPLLIEANRKALNAGFYYAETIEALDSRYEILETEFEPGYYRNITGNSALALGMTAAANLAKLPLVMGAYPITPASDILHELSKHKNFNVRTVQAEDEIAAACVALGAAYGGAIGLTASSGPGITLKGETINLALMAELPMVIVDVQRGGPSTGMPTKTEQSGLFQDLMGRNGDSPIPVIAAESPADCFDAALEAVRIALKFMTPVFLLSDAYLANGSEPWKLPEAAGLKPIEHNLVEKGESGDDFQVYARDAETLARRWPVPGVPEFEHRIGGIEKDSLTGNVSYDPDNHQKMVDTRAAKVANVANFVPPQDVFGDREGDLLVLSWGSSFGPCRAAVKQARLEGKKVSHVNLRWINPFPRGLDELLFAFKNVLIPELNDGQLALLIRAKFLVDAIRMNKLKGKPFHVAEILEKIEELT